jgi:DNA polymerase elongation subunit (family B)
MMLGTTAWGMTKVLGVTPDITLNRGLVYKLMSKLKQYTERYGFLIPSFTQAQKPVFEGKYQGAFVLDPDVGYYEDPVVVLDFASLYPALMIGWNLCYTTIVHDKNWMSLNPDKYETHCGVPFVKHSTYKGIIPMLEDEMGQQRKAAKKKMAVANKRLKEFKKKLQLLNKFKVIKMEKVSAMDDREFDDYVKQFPDLDHALFDTERLEEIKKAGLSVSEYEVEVGIYDSEQLANKIIMNSLYGMLGSPMATVPCVDIAKTITGLGRENLLAAKDYVESKYCNITGETENCKVIYGDSVLPDTPMLVKIRDDVQIVDAEQIGGQYGIGAWRAMYNDSDKEYMEMPSQSYAWTDGGWTRIFRIMRHKCGKRMVTVRTHTGIVTCTEDHSLINNVGIKMAPHECIVGQTKLLHRAPSPNNTNKEVEFKVNIGRKLFHYPTGQVFTSVKGAAIALCATTTQVFSMIHNQTTPMIKWVDNVESIPLTRDFAMILGMFHGDGSCGNYGKKSSWAINKADLKTMEKYMRVLNNTFDAVQFKILDTRKSSHVYKLVAYAVDSQKGVLVDFIAWFRTMSYYNNGEKMVHSSVLSSNIDIQQGYLEGLYDSDGTKGTPDLEISQKGKRNSLGIATLLYMVGYKYVVVGDRTDKKGIYRLRARMENIRKDPAAIKSITDASHEGYVYDLTTENHHFQAGVGNMIVSNTDSIFIKMPKVTVAKAIEYGQILDKRVQEEIFSLRAPMKMEYEKTYSPFIITRRKGYSGAKYEFNDRDFKVATMGYQLVKRDSALLCTKTMKTYFDYIFNVKDKKKAADSIKLMMHDLMGEHLTVDEFVITKKIGKAEYKTTPPHIKAWRRMVDRVGKAEAPAIGERFPYIVTKMNKKMGTDMGKATMDLQLANEIGFDNIQIDKAYYFETFIFNPMIKIMELVHGKAVTKKILDVKSYNRKDTVTAKNGNLLGFFGKTKVVTKKRYRGLGFDDDFLKEINEKRSKSAVEEKWELMSDVDADEHVMKLAELS